MSNLDSEFKTIFVADLAILVPSMNVVCISPWLLRLLFRDRRFAEVLAGPTIDDFTDFAWKMNLLSLISGLAEERSEVASERIMFGEVEFEIQARRLVIQDSHQFILIKVLESV